MPAVRIAALPIVAAALLSAGALPARAEGRAEFVSCQVMIDRARLVVEENKDTTVAPPDEAALRRCRQIVVDWTLRESRMSVDEQGRPLR